MFFGKGENKTLNYAFEWNSSIHQTKLINHDKVTEGKRKRNNPTSAIKITTYSESYLIENKKIPNSNYEEELNRRT